MSLIIILTFLVTTPFIPAISGSSSENTTLYPSPLLIQDEYFAHHVLIAEKSTHQLYLYKNTQDLGHPVLLANYQMATGKKSGNKVFQGDHRTPEGIYQLTEFIPKKTLIERHGAAGEIYGVGAFVMDYPNPIDAHNQKTGGGIWVHSTNDETRIEKGLDSRGCVVISNNDLKHASQFIELNRTPIIIVQDLHFVNNKNWNQSREEINQFINSWIRAWADEDLTKYLTHYHQKEFHDHFRGDFDQFKKYKQAVFRGQGRPSITVSNLSVFRTSSYALAIFRQNYKSTSIDDIGRKMLYLKKDEFYQWKIVAEIWSTIEPNSKEQNAVAFRPSMRFFQSSSPEGSN